MSNRVELFSRDGHRVVTTPEMAPNLRRLGYREKEVEKPADKPEEKPAPAKRGRRASNVDKG